MATASAQHEAGGWRLDIGYWMMDTGCWILLECWSLIVYIFFVLVSWILVLDIIIKDMIKIFKNRVAQSF
jgi:hypothetical protein